MLSINRMRRQERRHRRKQEGWIRRNLRRRGTAWTPPGDSTTERPRIGTQSPPTLRRRWPGP